MPNTIKGACILLLGLVACGDALDTSRPKELASTLGATLYEEVCHRVAYSDNPKDVSGQLTYQTCRHGAVAPSTAGPNLLALTTQRARFITAIDQAIDPNMVDDLRQLLTGMLPLYDDGTMQAHMASVSAAISAAAQSPEALAALGRLAARRGYTQSHSDFAQAWLSYKGLDTLTQALFQTAAVQNGERWALLGRSLAEQLGNAPEQFLHQSADDVAALSQFLLSPLEVSSKRAIPRWIVRRDIRGVAMPAMENNRPKAPFIDRDGDGLADIDHTGRYMGVDGRPLFNLPTPFPVAKRKDVAARTAHARALRADGALWYEYRDAAPTVLAAILEQLRTLVQAVPNAALAGAQILQASAGTQLPRTHTFADGSQALFTGFDAWASPYVDVAQALAHLGEGPALLYATQHAQAMWRGAETQVASLVALARDVASWRTQDPSLYARQPEPGKPWAEDLLDWGAQLAAEPGLIEDLILAFADPAMSQLGARLAEQMQYTDRIDFDLNDVNADVTGDFKTPVDRRAPDVAANQSIFERLLHLVHDASGQRICSNALDFVPNYAPCELFEIDDAAVFYVRAMVGKATLALHVKEDDEFVSSQLEGAALDDTNKQHSEMESFSGIDGFQKIDDPNIVITGYNADGTPQGPHAQYRTFSVTPGAAARLLFSMYDDRISPHSPYLDVRPGLQMLTPRLMVDGQPFDSVHWGTLFAWEKNHFFQDVQPLLQAFAKHDREDLLVRLISILHTHWQTPQSTTTQHTDPSRLDYAEQTGLSRLEPLLVRLLGEEDVFARLGALVQASVAHSSSDTQSGPSAVAALLEQALQDVPANLGAMRRVPQAGQTSVPHTPARLLWRGLGELATNVADNLPAESPAAKLADTAMQQAFELETAQGNLRFANRQLHALVTAWLGFAQTRMQAQLQAGQSWSAESLVQQTRDILGSMPMQLALQLASEMADDASLASEVGGMCQHLLTERMDATLEASSDALQILGDTANLEPLFKQAAIWLTPQTGLVSQSMQLLWALQQIDVAQTIPRLMQGLVRDMGDETPLAALVDIFGRVNRQMPGDDDILAAEDFTALLGVVDHLIQSPEHGFTRLVQLVEGRGAAAQSTH